jgi:hypothetical protein
MSKQPENTRADPMVYEFFRMEPSLSVRRARAASEAEDMTVADLKKAAADLQIDTGGVSTKEGLTAAVQASARPITAESGA